MAAMKKREPWLLYLLPSVIEVNAYYGDGAACSGRTGRKKMPGTNSTRRSCMHYLLRTVDGDGEEGLLGRIHHVSGEGRNDDGVAVSKVD